MEISRIDAGRHEPEIGPASLAEILAGLEVEFAPFAREKGLELQFVPTGAWVSTDRRLLRRILQNLIGNALKYTPAGSVHIESRLVGDRVRIEVSDTGPGIPVSKHSVIFKEFQRLESTSRDARGLGLGLSIVDRIARLLDAPLGLSSTPGKGSTFWVELPRTAPGTMSPPHDKVTTKPGSGLMDGCLTLCIENEPAVQSGMHALLTGWGCEVLLAASTAEAVAVVMDPLRLPCVILADYHLDDGDTGLKAIAAVRARTGADIPAVVITADTSAEVTQMLRDAGVLVLRKPLKAAALRSIVARYAVGRQTAAE
jgi:CheY-like chemotaxis protein